MPEDEIPDLLLDEKVNLRKVSVCDGKFWLDQDIKVNLDFVNRRAHHDFDCVAIFAGVNRSGKSTLASQCGAYLSGLNGHSFSEDNFVFSAQQFKDKLSKAKKYEVIIYDEARRGFNKMRTVTSENQNLMNLLLEAPKKNLFVFIITPFFFDLMQSVGQKAIFMVRCELIRNLFRGRAAFFNEADIEQLYEKKRKFHTERSTFAVAKPYFHFNFEASFGCDKELYEAKKDVFLKSAAKDELDSTLNHMLFLLYNLRGFYAFPIEELASLSRYTPAAVFKILERARLRYRDVKLEPQKRSYVKRKDFKLELQKEPLYEAGEQATISGEHAIGGGGSEGSGQANSQEAKGG